MQLEFTNDQVQFREMVARFLESTSPTTEVRRLIATEAGYDPAGWSRLCGELGVAGIHIPEAYGGSGFGPVELGIAAEQMGRYLYCGPFFASSVMAGYALLSLAEENHKAAFLPEIASGESIACLALDDLNSPEGVGAAMAANAAGKIQGTASMVLDAHNANRVFAIARGPEGLGLYTLKLPDAGIEIIPRQTLDQTRKLCSVSFDHAPAERLGEVNNSGLTRMWEHIVVALAHEMVGGAQRLFDSTVEYTKLRYQFGRPIGSFQALKHRCADLLMELEFAKAVTYDAAVCLAGDKDVPYAPAMAKAMASDLYIEMARAAVQLRGGIGFTWEDDTHLWFKRAKSSEVFMGSPHLHRERMMKTLEEVA